MINGKVSTVKFWPAAALPGFLLLIWTGCGQEPERTVPPTASSASAAAPQANSALPAQAPTIEPKATSETVETLAPTVMPSLTNRLTAKPPPVENVSATSTPVAPLAPTSSPTPTLMPAQIPTTEPTVVATVVPTVMATPTSTVPAMPTPDSTPTPAPTPALTPTPTTTATPTPKPTAAPAPTATKVATPLERLFDEIVDKTQRREAFSEVKEASIGFSAIEDMKRLRPEFIAAETDLKLYFALVKLSNARRDAHLRVRPVDDGLAPPESRPCVSAPIHVLPEILDVDSPTFFVAGVGEDLESPQKGDTIVGINGRAIDEYIAEFSHWTSHSTLSGLYWQLADDLPQRVSRIPQDLYSDRLDLTLEGPSGEHYDVSLPYSERCSRWPLRPSYPGFDQVLERENFNVFLDRNRQLLLLQWLDFELEELIKDIDDLMELAEEEELLDFDLIIDVTYSGGGSGGAFAIQRLVDRPFRPTFGNVRLSDLGKEVNEYYAGIEPRTGAPNVFGLNLSRSWLIDWAQTDAAEAISRGDEYTDPVPFKLAHLPRDSNGMLDPAPVHFRGDVAIINARTWGGSHLDQFVAMFVDNDLADFMGVPTGGFSNTWESSEILYLPGTRRPLVRFMWTVGHTIRPNGEVLEGNPAQPDFYIPLTRDNYEGYYRQLVERAIDSVGA